MANALTTWRGPQTPRGFADFDYNAFNQWRMANPGLSGWSGPNGGTWTEGSGTNAMVYDSAPLSATGGGFYHNGHWIYPDADSGGWVVYKTIGDKAENLNGTYADVLDANGNFVGQRLFEGVSDGNPEMNFGIGAAMMLPAMYLTAAGAGAAGAAGGAGATEAAGGGSWMSGVEGSALAGPEVAAGTGGITFTGGAAGAAGAAGAGGALQTLGKAASGFDWSNLIGPAVSAIGGIAGANAAGKAADTQAQATQDALGLQREMFNKTVELQEPFRQNGIAAGNRMLQVLGIGGDPNAPDYNMMNRRFTADDLYADPSYNFRLSEGQKVLERSRAAKGGYFSGATGKALTRYGQDYASTEFGKAWDRNEANKTNTFNRYASLYGSGQTAANTTGAAGQNFGNSGAQLITQGGDARAAGVVGQANAFTDAITNGWRAYQSSQNRQYENALLDRILSRA